MLDYRQFAVACHFGSVSKADIEAYIQSVIESDEEYENRIFEAHANDLSVTQVKMLEVIGFSFPNFDINTDDYFVPCRSELKKQLGLLLDRKITPLDFCIFFNSMEMELMIDS